MSDQQRIEQFLLRLKDSGLSSPHGYYWDRFYKSIHSAAKRNGQIKERIPIPLILNGTKACNADKLERLGQQLHWSAQHGCLDHAFSVLMSIDEVNWNSGSLSAWHKPETWFDEEDTE